MVFHITQEEILEELTKTLSKIDDESIDNMIEMLLDADKVFFVGVGRVLLSLEAIAKRLAHLGIHTVVVGQITEPAITEKDVLIVGSGSGESLFPLGIARKAKHFNAKIIHIGANPNSSMREITDLFVRIPVQTKLGLAGEIPSIQPMTSLFEQSLLLLGDSVALEIIRKNNVDMPELWKYHANLE